MRARHTWRIRVRGRLLRRRWPLLVALGMALAIGVPIAWASFNDVPPGDPFIPDINAIQGAGITSGCGGGNFCPSANITREAEAAFVHRAAVRAGYLGSAEGELNPSGTDMGSLTVDVGGVSGGTQFVVLNAEVTTYIESTSGCPCETGYVITDSSYNGLSYSHYNLNNAVASGGAGLQTGGASVVVPVPSGSTQTFHVVTFNAGGTGTVYGYAEMTAATAPFSSTGTDTLTASKAAHLGPYATHEDGFPNLGK